MDYDFITTCNWTSIGTFTLRAYRGSSANVVSSYTIYYRKKGTSTWSSTTNGQIVISSTGEWEVANDWNKSGNDVLTHSYYGITAINQVTDVYFNESTLGTTIGNYFLNSCWYNCSSLTSMPVGFNLPSGITSVGSAFLQFCWASCSSLASMPSGFNLPSGITSVGNYFLQSCWFNCTNLKADAYTEDITFEFSASSVFGGTCPISPNSVTASKLSPVNVAVNRATPSTTGVSTMTGVGSITF